jgi:hypothetical protein
VLDRDAIVTGSGGFVRFVLATRVLAGVPVPSVRELQLVDR